MAEDNNRPYNARMGIGQYEWQHYSIPLRKTKDYTEASEIDAQLFFAADVGNVNRLQQMLDLGADVNFQHCAGTPLTRAARRGHLECVQVLLDHGADVNMSGNFNYETCTALHAAATNGHYQVAQLLIDCGADVHARRDQESTPLHDAAKFGHPDIAELLLHHGAIVNARNRRGKTPLYLTASEGQLDGLRWVLEAAIEYYHYKGYHYNAIFFPRDAVDYLLDNKDTVNALSMADLQDLRTSLLRDNLDTIKLILEERPPGNVKQRHLQLLKVLIDAGANTEILDNDDSGPLEQAIINKHEEFVDCLVKHGCVLNRTGAVYGWKRTPLHFACDQGTENIVKLLLDNGADPNAPDQRGETPLHTAVCQGEAEFVRALLHHGARVDVLDNAGGTPLHEVKTLDCARLLVEHGADVTALRKDGRTVLFTASDRCGEGTCVEFLIDHGADPLKEDKNGISALYMATHRIYFEYSDEKDDGGLGCARVLMKHGAKMVETKYKLRKAVAIKFLGLALAHLRSGSDVNAVDDDGFTALHCAAEKNFPAGVKMLLEEGADPHIVCCDKSPLDIALLNGFEEVAEMLVMAGAIPNSDIYNLIKPMGTYRTVMCKIQRQNSEGNCPMNTDSYKPVPIYDLLEAEVNIKVARRKEVTPLHIVSFKGSTSHVKLLLENKADPNKKDKKGLTPLHFAAFEGHHDVGVLLLENGADVKAEDETGRTAAHIAAQCRCFSYLELLLTHGADVNARDTLGCTPLHLAERNRCTECVQLLVKHGADTNIPRPQQLVDTKLPPKLIKTISKCKRYVPVSADEDSDSDSDLGFGLFD